MLDTLGENGMKIFVHIHILQPSVSLFIGTIGLIFVGT
ncbi:hypothetical protein CW298_1963 [Salmonella enterica subsp. enterica serovar Muenchen]|nr:hypothetical protein CW298_1963 [Salmonella enterica subsp. enterica serovar Muenchen]